MKSITEYNSHEELTEDFNEWFGKWLVCGGDMSAITEEIISIMLSVTGWEFEEADLHTLDRRNFVYWYCVRLLFLNGDSYYYQNDVFEYLDLLRPFDVGNEKAIS